MAALAATLSAVAAQVIAAVGAQRRIVVARYARGARVVSPGRVVLAHCILRVPEPAYTWADDTRAAGGMHAE